MRIIIFIYSLLFTFTQGISQCVDPIVADFSFEEGTFDSNIWPQVTGVWYRDDGCNLYDNEAYHLETSACSNGGGGYQLIVVEPNTTYHLSCYVLNGLSDEYPSLRTNGGWDSISPASDEWSFISQEFTSGPDTLATIGFYSAGACFDLFRVTCNSVVHTNDLHDNPTPYSIFPTSSSNQFIIETTEFCKMEILDFNGQLVEQMNLNIGLNYFGEKLPKSSYIVRVFLEGKVYVDRVIKI